MCTKCASWCYSNSTSKASYNKAYQLCPSMYKMEKLFLKKVVGRFWRKKNEECSYLKKKVDVVNKNNIKPQFNTPCSKLSYKIFYPGAHKAMRRIKFMQFFILELNYGAPRTQWCSCERHAPFCEDDYL